MDFLILLWHNAYIRGAISGILVAARVDYLAFKAMQDPAAILAYNWKIAAWRWFQGAVIGVVSVSGSSY